MLIEGDERELGLLSPPDTLQGLNLFPIERILDLERGDVIEKGSPMLTHSPLVGKLIGTAGDFILKASSYDSFVGVCEGC